MKLDGEEPYDFAVGTIYTVAERKPNSKWYLHNFQNKHCVLALAIDGESFYSFQEHEFAIRRGDVLFFPVGFKRSARSSQENPWHFITITFDIVCLSSEPAGALKGMPQIVRNAPSEVAENFFQLNGVWTGKKRAYLLKSRSLIQNILYNLIQLNEASRHNPAHYRRIESVRQYIQENYTRNLRVEDLAAMTNFSPSYFRMLFKKITGMSVMQYLTYVRIGKAKDLLVSGESNVSETALKVGYRDIYYFSRQFKRTTGSPPSSFNKF